MKKIYLLLFTSLLTSLIMGQNIAFEQVLPLPPAPQIIANFDWVDASSIAFADIDNDNDQDVLITGSSNAGIIAKLYTNDGNGNFVEVTETPFVGVSNGSIAFADIDNDNDQDVLITGSGIAKL
ncbi:MAG: VCBS repeat-containing protein, partial [Bacteroidales bacterium]|nr:VCBS repeat-containing protein [Bacteroidales bacterium]